MIQGEFVEEIWLSEYYNVDGVKMEDGGAKVGRDEKSVMKMMMPPETVQMSLQQTNELGGTSDSSSVVRQIVPSPYNPPLTYRGNGA